MAARFPACFIVVALAALITSGIRTTELKVEEGDTASLRCPLSADLSGSYLRVTKDQSKNIVHVWKNGRDHFADQNEKFKGRTSLSDEAWRRGSVDLYISSMQPDDAGTYRFFVNKKFECQIVLEVVKSQEPSDDGEAPPSAPQDDQHSDKKGMYIGIGISVAIAVAIAIAIAIGLSVHYRVYRFCRRNTDPNIVDDTEAGEADRCPDGSAQRKSDADPHIGMSLLHQ